MSARTYLLHETAFGFIDKPSNIYNVQYRPVIRKPDIIKSGYKKGLGRVPADLLFVIT
jgi:hypothetical protein